MQPCYPESPTAATYDGRDPSNGIVASSDVPPDKAADPQLSPKRLDSIDLPDESRPLVRVRTTDSIVGNREAQVRTFSLDVYVTTRLDQIVVPTIWPMP
jgi:hypothetical protein